MCALRKKVITGRSWHDSALRGRLDFLPLIDAELSKKPVSSAYLGLSRHNGDINVGLKSNNDVGAIASV